MRNQEKRQPQIHYVEVDMTNQKLNSFQSTANNFYPPKNDTYRSDQTPITTVVIDNKMQYSPQNFTSRFQNTRDPLMPITTIYVQDSSPLIQQPQYIQKPTPIHIPQKSNEKQYQEQQITQQKYQQYQLQQQQQQQQYQQQQLQNIQMFSSPPRSENQSLLFKEKEQAMQMQIKNATAQYQQKDREYSQLQYSYQQLQEQYQQLKAQLQILQRQISEKNQTNQVDILNQQLLYYKQECDRLQSDYQYISKLEEQILQVTQQLEEVSDALLIQNEQNQQLHDQLNQSRMNQQSQIQSQYIQNYELQLQQKSEQMKNLLKEVDMYQQIISQKTQEIQQTQIDSNKVITQCQYQQQEIENLKRQLLKCKSDLVSSQIESSQLAQLKHDYMILNDRYQEQQNYAEQMKQQFNQYDQDLNEKQQQEQQIEQLIEQRNDLRNKLEISTQTIGNLQQKLMNNEFIINEKSQLEVQLNSLKQNINVLDQDKLRITDLIQQKQREIDAGRNENIQLQQRLKQGQQANILINEQKMEIEQWKSKVGRFEAMFNEFKKEEQVKIKCLNDQILQLQKINNNLQQDLQKVDQDANTKNRQLQEQVKKLKDREQELQYQIGVQQSLTEKYQSQLQSQQQYQQQKENQTQSNSKEVNQLKQRIIELEQNEQNSQSTYKYELLLREEKNKQQSLQAEISRLNQLVSQLRTEHGQQVNNDQTNYRWIDDKLHYVK